MQLLSQALGNVRKSAWLSELGIERFRAVRRELVDLVLTQLVVTSGNCGQTRQHVRGRGQRRPYERIKNSLVRRRAPARGQLMSTADVTGSLPAHSGHDAGGQ